jgi:hypothetical protein
MSLIKVDIMEGWMELQKKKKKKKPFFSNFVVNEMEYGIPREKTT